MLPRRAFSLLEVLLTVALLGLLLFAIGGALSHVLDTTMLGENRAALSQSAEELASRLSSEARSSTAVFIPASDVLGAPNVSPNGAHEVDLFRKGSDGTPSFVAYRFDASSGTVDRFEYTPAIVGPPTIVHRDRMADHIGGFSANRLAPSAIPGVVGGQSVHSVNIYYGSAELVGGNSIVAVSLVAGLLGEPQHDLTLHLASRAAPTDVSILVGSNTPNPSPSPSQTPITVGFMLIRPNVHPPHGPNRQGDPGGDPGGRPGVPGYATLLGNGSGATDTWLSLYAIYPVVQNGIYQFTDSEGNAETAIITCDEGDCPPFVPLPIPTTDPNVVFQTVN